MGRSSRHDDLRRRDRSTGRRCGCERILQFTTADLEEFFPNSEALLLLSLKVERKELSQQLKQLGQSGIEPALRLAEFVLLKEAQSQDLARYGCPIGSLISELGKNELQLKDRVSELSFLQLDWLREQFTRLLVELNSSAQFSTKRDIEKASLALASKLFAMIQGFVLVAQSQEDESWLRKQLKVLSQDLKQKRFLSQVL